MLKNKKSSFGINVAGHVSGEFGLGQAARGTLRAMEAASVPFTVRDLKIHWQSNTDIIYKDTGENNFYPINCIYTNPNWVQTMLEGYFKNIDCSEYLKGKYNIGVWLWELPKFPTDWEFAFELFDEIWAPSTYTAGAISSASPIPVITVPISIELPLPQLDRESLALPSKPFIFLFIFDFGSSFERKNPLSVINAFQKAFDKSNQDVLLVLKFSNSKLFPYKRDRLQAMTEGWESIQLIDRHLTKEELHSLINSCNCYVSLHHAEGFGLTMAEAMYYGKPVIATGYSSNMDFMNVGNSFPVQYDLIETTEDYGFFPKGSIWAEANVDRAAYLMQYVFENQEEAIEVGSQAARDIRDLLSPQAVGKTIKERIEYIIKRTDSGNLSARSSSLLEAQTQNNWLTSQLKAWQLTAKQVHKELKQSQI